MYLKKHLRHTFMHSSGTSNLRNPRQQQTIQRSWHEAM